MHFIDCIDTNMATYSLIGNHSIRDQIREGSSMKPQGY